MNKTINEKIPEENIERLSHSVRARAISEGFDLCLVKDGDGSNYLERLYFSRNRAVCEYKSIQYMNEEQFDTYSWEPVSRENWYDIEKPKQVEMTLEQVCEELGKEIKIIK